MLGWSGAFQASEACFMGPLDRSYDLGVSLLIVCGAISVWHDPKLQKRGRMRSAGERKRRGKIDIEKDMALYVVHVCPDR